MKKLILIFVFALAAFVVRTWWLTRPVLSGDTVMLQSVDPWIHLRRSEALAADPWQSLDRDAYFIATARRDAPVGPAMDYGMAWAARFLFGPSPGDQQVARLCAYVPPIAAAMTVALIAFIGMAIRNTTTGLWAAAVAAVGPGLFFYYSRLGACDHHVLEVMLTSAYALCLVMALGRNNTLTSPVRRAAWSLLGGIVLALYFWTWIAAVYWVGIICAFVLIQGLQDIRNGKAFTRVPLAILPGLGLAALLVTVIPWRYPLHALQCKSLLAAACLTITLSALVYAARRIRLAPATALYGTGLLLLAAIGVSAFLTPPGSTVTWLISRMAPGTAARSIEEVAPLFWRDGALTVSPAWHMFGPLLPVAVLGLLQVSRDYLKRGEPALGFLMIWGIINFAATCCQNRFGYYAAVTTALLAASAIDRLIASVSAGWKESDRKETDKRGSRTAPLRSSFQQHTRLWIARLWAAALLLSHALWTLPERATLYDGPNDAWKQTLDWIRRSTPEPFGNPDAYLQPSRLRDADAGYGIMAGWETGYWITALGRRVPCCNPTQAGAERSGRFFTGDGDTESTEHLDSAHARFVIVDSTMVPHPCVYDSTLGSQFYALLAWAGMPGAMYYEWFDIPYTNENRAVFGITKACRRPLFKPLYYRSAAFRLYTLGGQSSPPQRMIVITWELGDDGTKQVAAAKSCDTLREALDELNKSDGKNRDLVSDHPFRTCVAVNSMPSFRRIFDSSAITLFEDGSFRPETRVFEYMPRDPGQQSRGPAEESTEAPPRTEPRGSAAPTP